ncbi:MAG: hypothetical protein ACJA08_002123 [Cyclobacteriaceae bacterium]|jgi:hypothetical protein
MKKIFYLSALFVALIGYKAQAQFTMSAEVRPRTEFRNGFKTLTSESKEASFFTEQRSRLYLDYASDAFKFKLAFQDIRVWGETTQIFKEEYGKTAISEAWGQYYVNPSISIKAGRQIISYDNQRFLGGLEWAQQGRRHDAVLFIYEGLENKTKLHLGFAYNQDDDKAEPTFLQGEGAGYYSVAGNYKTMQYGWFNKSFADASISILALNAGYQNADTTVSFKQTLGLTGSTKLGGLSIGGDFYYQMGEQGGKDISAVLAGINATIKTKATPLTFGVEYVSGDNNTANKTNNAFSPDFGTNHAFNGYMDYFYVGPANGAVGVTDLYLKTAFKVAEGTLKINIHEFLTGSTQKAGDGSELEKAMGTEIDLVYSKTLKGGVTWNLGYSQMLATDTMEALRGGEKGALQCWAWTMITFKPTLFKSE